MFLHIKAYTFPQQDTEMQRKNLGQFFLSFSLLHVKFVTISQSGLKYLLHIFPEINTKPTITLTFQEMLVNSSDLLKTHCTVYACTQCVSLAHVTVLTFPHSNESFKHLLSLCHLARKMSSF